MEFLLVLLLVPLLIIPAFAESQTLPTDKGTLDVKLTYDAIEPNTLTKINIDFINPQTQKIQEHIDYTISVSKDGETVFTMDRLTHTSLGTVKIPIEFNLGEGTYSMNFNVEGILFQPIPPETVAFDILVGEAHAQPTTPPPDDGENGGCLIATATFGSELAPQVQQLRELRDNTIMKTNSGIAFMTTFQPALLFIFTNHIRLRKRTASVERNYESSINSNVIIIIFTELRRYRFRTRDVGIRNIHSIVKHWNVYWSSVVWNSKVVPI